MIELLRRMGLLQLLVSAASILVKKKVPALFKWETSDLFGRGHEPYRYGDDGSPSLITCCAEAPSRAKRGFIGVSLLVG